MTHDELLKFVKFRLECAESKYLQEEAPAVSALLAVVELHKPLDNLIAEFCSHCTEMSGKDIYTLYPCLTIQAIEKELG
jgi:hypothetical protein